MDDAVIASGRCVRDADDSTLMMAVDASSPFQDRSIHSRDEFVVGSTHPNKRRLDWFSAILPSLHIKHERWNVHRGHG